MEEVRDCIKKIEEKIELIKKNVEELLTEAAEEKVLDLEDKAGDRKYLLKTKSDLYANTILTGKMPYVLGKVVTGENDEEEFRSIVIDGA